MLAAFRSTRRTTLLWARQLSTVSGYASLNVPRVGEISVPTGLFINNEWTQPAAGDTFPTVNPATGAHLVDVAHASAADVDRAVQAARSAFRTTWGLNVPASERGRALYRLADLVERDAAKIAAVESLNSGKGLRIASASRECDVADAVACLRYYAGMADKIVGQAIDTFGGDKLVYTLHQPIGVCGQIIPWNYPLLMWAWKVAPAVAAGCTVVMKPSELTPLTAMMMCDLAVEAGFPPGVLNTVPGLGRTTGDSIARHMDIDKTAFTGSVATGRAISIAAASSNLKKVTLELGGKSPLIVFDSADVEEAAEWTANGIWYNSGQDCCASSRVYVHESIYDAYLDALALKASTAAIGAPDAEETSFGPLISAGQRDKVLSYIDSGVSEGARLVAGGATWGSAGFYVKPTILADTDSRMKVVKEEIFGPVVCVSKFSTEAEALEVANNTEFGLAAAVFTSDFAQANRVARALDAGTVWINQYGSVPPNVPFGGFKQSGIGRELGTYGLEAYTQVKTVNQNISGKPSWPV